MLSVRSGIGIRQRISVFRKTFASKALATSQEQNDFEGIHRKVSIVHDLRTASQSIEALLRLPEGTPVAWSTQALPPRASPAMVTMCGYAGDAFQGGAWTFICPSSTHEAAVWGLLREFFRDRIAKTVCFDIENFASHLYSRGIQADGCVHDAQTLMRISGLKEKGFDSSVIDVLDKRTLSKRESMFGDQDRPWEAPSLELNCLSDEWVSSACADAHAIFHIYQRMRSKMLKNGLISAEAKNSFEAYEQFYSQVERILPSLGKHAFFLDEVTHRNIMTGFEKDREYQQSIFDSWAQKYCDQASQVDVTFSMLRHMLFAPCQNMRNKRERIPAEKEFFVCEREVRGHDVETLPTHKKRTKKKRVLVRGAGLEAQEYTTTGTPSTSISALQSLVSTLSSSEQPELQAACSAINGKLRAQTSRLAAQNFEKNVKKVVDPDEQVRVKTKTDFERGRLQRSVPSSVVDVLRAKKDHEVLVLNFENLNLCALADLSECERLKKRLRFNDGVHAYLAKEFSKEISHALYNGRCVLKGEGITVEKAFPEKFRMARMLDGCMSKGPRIEIVKNAMKCDQARASQLIDGWFKVHPAVESWCKEELGRMRAKKVAQTIRGRQRVLKIGKGKRSVFVLNEGLTFAIEGSVGDFMMQSLLKIAQSERINALAWRAMFADANRIVLHGPSWSTEEAVPAVIDTLASPNGGGPILESALHQLGILCGESFRALRRVA
ncbi:unnamed protein product [Agarophyton chilense]